MVSVQRRWSLARDEQLRHYAEQSLSATQISAILGVSRSAVIGRASRLGVTLRGQWHYNPHDQKSQRRAGGVGHAQKPLKFLCQSTQPHDVAQNRNGFISILHARDNQCRWVMDGRCPEGHALCCGHATNNALPYCPKHAQRAYERFPQSEAA